MEQSQRRNVVRGFSLVHDPSLAKYGVVLGGPPPSGSHYILEGEVSKPWSRGITGQPGMRRALNASITSLKA